MTPISSQTPLDRRIARLAASQHGVTSLHQLRTLGLSVHAVQKRVAAGRLHRIHRGVYAVGHPKLTVRGRWMAAVLACGPGAVVSHRTAGALSGLRFTQRWRIDVIAPKRRGRKLHGIDVHSGATLRPHDITVVDGIPCTSVARTLLDLAEIIRPSELEQAVDRAHTLELFDLTAIDELLSRSNGRRGARALRSAIRAYQPTLSRSELERRFFRLCAKAGVPRPTQNLWLGDHEHDFVWEAERVIL